MSRRRAILGLALFGVLAGAAHLCSYYPFSAAGLSTPVWPATTLIIGFLLVRPEREWPALGVLTFVEGYLLVLHANPHLPWRVLGAVGAAMLQIFGGAYLIKMIAGPRVTFRRQRDVLALGAIIVGFNFFTSFLMALFVEQVRPEGFAVIIGRRWIEQSAGIVVLTPLVVSAAGLLGDRARWRPRRWVEAALVLIGSYAVARIAFYANPALEPFFPAPYLAMIPVCFAALRFGPAGASGSLAIVALTVTLGIAHGPDWPQAADMADRMAEAQFFLIVVGTAGLVLAASVAERRTAAEARRRSEGEMVQANRILRTISACNVALAQARSESDLLNRICHVVAASEGFAIAWAAMAGHDPDKTVRMVALAGLSPRVFEDVPISWGDNPRGQGPAGVAIRTGRPHVYADLKEQATGLWREEVLRTGASSGVGLPLRSEGRAFGALSFYARTTDLFDAAAVTLLQEMADSVAAGILALRAKEQQAQAEAEIRRLLAEAEEGRRTLLSILEDRDQAERARDESEERYHSAMLNAAIGMALVSPTGQWLEVNPALCRIVGYTRAEMLAVDFQAITHPDDLDEDVQRLRSMLEGTVSAAVGEKRYLHKSGRAVWVRVNVSLVRTADGRALHFVTQVQDITARREAEAALEGTVQRLQVALRASKFGIWRYNVQTRVLEWDARMYHIFGLPPAARPPSLEAVLGLVAPEDQARVRRSLERLPDPSRGYEIVFRIGRGGDVRHVELQALVRHDERGRPEWVVGVAGDLTAVVQATTESERLRAQLLQSQKMEALGTLAAGVAHDFNNLLTGINGFVELASATLGPGHEAAELLKQARRGAMSARDLVRRILSFSRSNLGAKQARVDLPDVVRETAPLVAAALPANVSLSLAVACDHAAVVADPAQLQQVLMNLCTNAAHAIGERAGKIEIGVRTRARQDEEEAELWVSDSGCGMDEATQRRIFEPFFTTKAAGVGTGLGLSIVQDIAKAHAGRVEVRSQLGRGSTFSVFLPIAEAAAEPYAREERPPAPRGGGEAVLVVDDEPSIGTVIRLALERHGFAPEVHGSSLSAWERFRADPARWSLLLVDLNMPDLSGTELVARIREINARVPVILVSGRFEATGIGETGTVRLKKPFEIAELMAAVRAALAGGPAAPVRAEPSLP